MKADTTSDNTTDTLGLESINADDLATAKVLESSISNEKHDMQTVAMQTLVWVLSGG